MSQELLKSSSDVQLIHTFTLEGEFSDGKLEDVKLVKSDLQMQFPPDMIKYGFWSDKVFNLNVDVNAILNTMKTLSAQPAFFDYLTVPTSKPK